MNDKPWWRQGRWPYLFSGLAMLASMLVPDWLAWDKLTGQLLSPKDALATLSYLIALQVCATLAYCAILWSHWNRSKHRESDCTQEKIVFPHLFPLTVLVGITNTAIGFLSYITPDKTLAHPDFLSFGTTPIHAFPNVVIPTGVVLLACWGSFFYNCQQMLSRIVNRDFPQSIWISGAFRTGGAILASIFVFAVIFSDNKNGHIWPDGRYAGSAMVLAFLSGFFPLTTIRQLGRFVLDRLSQTTQYFGKFSYTPITVLDGVTNEVQDRLLEAGIDSLQLLAYTSLADLRDPYSKALPYEDAILQDWQDQARLALYFGDERELAAMRTLGIRTFTDLKNYQRAARTAADAGQNWEWPALAREGKIFKSPEEFKAFVLQGQFPG